MTSPSTPEAKPERSPLPVALLGIVIISFSAIFFELSGVNGLTGTVFRMWYAVPVLLVVWLKKRGYDTRPRRDRLIGLASGAFLAVDITAWQISIKMIGTGLSTLIANSQVIIVPIVAWLILKEDLNRRILIAMPIVIAGMALVTGLGDPAAYGERPVFGVMVAVGAAFLYSAFLMLFRQSNRQLVPAVGPLLDAVLAAAIVATLIGLIGGGLQPNFSWETHVWLIALGAGPQAVGWLMIGYAIARLPSATTSFLIVLQPTLTLIWGVMIFNEVAAVIQYVGVALVLAGILFATSRSGGMSRSDAQSA